MPEELDPALAAMIRNLEANTGRPLAGWLELVSSLGPMKYGQAARHLKEERGLTHGYATMLVHLAARSSGAAAAGSELLEAQYAGQKAGLQPLYEHLISTVRNSGDDVEVAPRKEYVSLRRSKQFALVQASTRSRLDVGLVLKGLAPAGRLEAAGSFNAMVTHRARVESLADIDEELVAWLRQAYAAA